jgi:hypothetical protein
MVRTGANSYLKYGWETTFATKSSAMTKPFGLQQSVGSWTVNNSRKDLRKLGQVEREAFAYGQQNGSLSVEFILSNPWIFQALYGAPSTTGSSSDYTHTYPHATNGQPKTVQPISAEIGFQAEDATNATVVRSMLGGVLTGLSISTNIDDLVNVSADITYGNEADPSNTVSDFDTTPPADDIAFPYTFAHGTLKWYDGSSLSTVAEVQSANISFTQNVNLLYRIGSNKATAAYRQGFDINGSFQASWKDDAIFTQMLDQINANPTTELSSGTTTVLELKFTNGASGTSEKTITMNVYGVAIDSQSVDGIRPVDPVFETVNWEARGVTIVADNSTATAL